MTAAAAQKGVLDCRTERRREGANGFETSQSANVQSTAAAIWAPFRAQSLSRKQTEWDHAIMRRAGSKEVFPDRPKIPFLADECIGGLRQETVLVFLQGQGFFEEKK